MNLKEKRRSIKELEKQKKKILTKMKRLARLGTPKRNSTAIKRAWKTIGYVVQIRSLQFQQQIIASQPIPKFTSGCAIVGDGNKDEVIQLKSGEELTIKK